MSNDKPGIGPFERAIQRLEEGLARYRTDTSDIQIRDGLVQRFKFTYELGHKALKRHLEYASANPAQFGEMTFQDLIRSANERGMLLRDWTDWRGFRDMRAQTSHTYNEDVAVEVVEGIPRFVEEAVYLHDQLRRRLASARQRHLSISGPTIGPSRAMSCGGAYRIEKCWRSGRAPLGPRRNIPISISPSWAMSHYDGM